MSKDLDLEACPVGDGLDSPIEDFKDKIPFLDFVKEAGIKTLRDYSQHRLLFIHIVSYGQHEPEQIDNLTRDLDEMVEMLSR